MQAIVTVNGKDTVGILANVSAIIAKAKGNIIEVSQTVGQGIFSMFMVVEIDNLNIDFAELADQMEQLGTQMGLKIHCMHEDVFSSMHHI